MNTSRTHKGIFCRSSRLYHKPVNTDLSWLMVIDQNHMMIWYPTRMLWKVTIPHGMMPWNLRFNPCKLSSLELDFITFRVRPMKCEWVFKVKTDMDRNLYICKARLIAKSFKQFIVRLWRNIFACCHAFIFSNSACHGRVLWLWDMAKWMSKPNFLT